MCEFLSWVEKGDKVYFLTHDLIYNTPRGEMIQKQFPGNGELIGHAAIRVYFEIENGKDRECTDFSIPDKFPAEIIGALKVGKFKGFPFPSDLISKPLNDDYKAKCKLLDNDYKVKLLDNAYKAKCKPWDDDYNAKCNLLNDDYDAKYKLLDDDYWDLFANPQNRAEAWR